MKYEIILRILFELLSKKSVTAKYLSSKYEVSVRTIYRYIETLELAGVPLYTTRGRDGGFQIIDTFKFSSTFMTVEEFEQVINTLSAIVESVPNKTLSGAIDKLKATIKNEYSGFEIKSGNLVIDGGPWGDTVGYKGKLKIIQESIEQEKKLFICYHDRNGKVSERTIEPHVIVFKQGIWYVFAFCELRNEFRFFKTGRIESATVLNDKFYRQKINKLDLPFDTWYTSVKAQQIEFEIKKEVLSDVEEWLGIENVFNENGKYIARVSLPFDDGLVSKIMSFGKGLTVISPKELRERVVSSATELLKNYK